jgi:RNA recognition motif-containing protein
MNIYVSNLSFNVNDDDLKGFFEGYGEVSSAKIITDKFTNKSRGFGFVEMPNDAEGAKAVAELNGGVVEGRNINVTEARPREERTGGNGGNKRSFSNNNSNRW